MEGEPKTVDMRGGDGVILGLGVRKEEKLEAVDWIKRLRWLRLSWRWGSVAMGRMGRRIERGRDFTWEFLF